MTLSRSTSLLKCLISNSSLSPFSIQLTDFYPRYRDYMTTYRFSQLPDFHYCKNPECNSGQVHDFKDGLSRMKCYKCGHDTCASCDVSFHEGKTCDYYKYEKETCLIVPTNEEDPDAVKKWTNQCPQCKVPIEREDGCDHMECKS